MLIGFIPILLVGMYVTSRPQPEWFMYLNDYAANQMLRLYLDGHSEIVAVPPVGRYSSYTNYSNDGRYRAACEFDETSREQSLLIYDLMTETLRIDFEFGQIAYCGNNIFSPDGQYLAIGVLNYAPIPDYMRSICEYPDLPKYPEECTEKRIKPVWQIFVLDIKTGKVVNEINSDTPYFAELATQNKKYSNDYFMPAVLLFDTTYIKFAGMVWYPIDTPPNYFGAWKWNITSEAVWEDKVSLNHSYEQRLVPGNEVAWIETDNCLPFSYHAFASVIEDSPNLIRVLDSNNKNTVAYFDSQTGIRSIQYINDGKQLAVQLYPKYDFEYPARQVTYRWIILSRDGTRQDFTQSFEEKSVSAERFLIDPIYIMPAPNGYMMLDSDDETAMYPSHTQLDYYSGNTKRTLWQGTNWRIAWYPQARNTAFYQPSFKEVVPEVPPDYQIPNIFCPNPDVNREAQH